VRRPALGILAAAVVAALLLAGGGVAAAAWRSQNTGTATARAGQIGTPTGVVIGTITCTTSGGTTTATIPVSWTGVTGAGEYTVASGRALGLFSDSKTVTGTSTTLTTTTLLLTMYVTVTARAGNWTGAPSATVSRAVTCPAAGVAPRSTGTTGTAPTTTTAPAATSTTPSG
jgi:hypothetical protein